MSQDAGYEQFLETEGGGQSSSYTPSNVGMGNSQGSKLPAFSSNRVMIAGTVFTAVLSLIAIIMSSVALSGHRGPHPTSMSDFYKSFCLRSGRDSVFGSEVLSFGGHHYQVMHAAGLCSVSHHSAFSKGLPPPDRALAQARTRARMHKRISIHTCQRAHARTHVRIQMPHTAP